MKNQKIISGTCKVFIFFFLFCSLAAAAQNNNPNQSNGQNQNNSGRTTEQNNNINNPYTTPPPDSINRVRYNETEPSKHPASPGAFEQQEHVRQLSGQNQATVPPNAAGPDTNVHRITQDGNFTNNASDRTIEKTNKEKRNNTTLTKSVKPIPSRADTIK